MVIYLIRLHGTVVAASPTEERARQYRDKHKCPGTFDGPCADWQDDGNICSDIKEVPWV